MPTDRRGEPRFCNKLGSVTDTEYRHAIPSLDDNYYWVVACAAVGYPYAHAAADGYAHADPAAVDV